MQLIKHKLKKLIKNKTNITEKKVLTKQYGSLLAVE